MMVENDPELFKDFRRFSAKSFLSTGIGITTMSAIPFFLGSYVPW